METNEMTVKKDIPPAAVIVILFTIAGTFFFAQYGDRMFELFTAITSQEPEQAQGLVPPNPAIVAQLAQSKGFQRLISINDEESPQNLEVAVYAGETIRWVNNSPESIALTDLYNNSPRSHAVNPGEFLEVTYADAGTLNVRTTRQGDSVALAIDRQTSNGDTNKVMDTDAAGPLETFQAIQTSPTPVRPTCYVNFSADSIMSGESTVLSYTSSNASWFSIKNVGHMIPNGGGSFRVSPSVTTDYSGTVADALGNQYNCYNGPAILTVAPMSPANILACPACPAGFEVRNNECMCPIGQHEDATGRCVVGESVSALSGCPTGSTGTPPNCTCSLPHTCSANDVINACTGALIQRCGNEYRCVSGVCIPLPPTVVTWNVTPLLVHRGDTTTVTWEVLHVASCSVSTDTTDDYWTTLRGSEVSSPLNAQTTFTLNCLPLPGSGYSPIGRTAIVGIVPEFNEQ